MVLKSGLFIGYKSKITQPRDSANKNKGVTETDNSSMVGRGSSISAIFVKSAKPINSSI